MTALVRAGLEGLIARESARRLAAPGGSQRAPSAGRRRRPASSHTGVILRDTSVWVDHFRIGNARLAALLADARVAFVVGELACGNLRDRDEILGYLRHLPETPVATHAEALRLVTAHGLDGSGVGWIDVHLLASALMAASPLTQMRAERLGLARIPQRGRPFSTEPQGASKD